jgi:hypothetical protein
MWVMFVVVDLLVEPQMARLGFWSFGGSISWLTLFHGHYYQFPIYESLFISAMWTAWAAIRFFRDDSGHLITDRGIEKLRVQGGKRTCVRFLALVGAFNIAFLLLYNIPIQVFALNADSWPTDVTQRTYMTNGLCGVGTSYACSGPSVPIPRPGSVHLTPEGTLSPGRQPARGSSPTSP